MTGVCSEIASPIVSRFAEIGYLIFIANQLTGCRMMRDLGVRNLGRDYQQFYIFSFFVYFYFTLLLRGYFLSTYLANFLDDIY